MVKAADALIRRYLQSRYKGMPCVGYKPFCQYLVAPNPPPDDDERMERPIQIVTNIMNHYPESVMSIVRDYWGEARTQKQIAESHKLTPRRVSAIVDTIRFQVVKDCIEPFTMRA